MIDMARHSVILFFQGRLFQDPAKVVRQVLIGGGGTALLALLLAMMGLPLWAVAIIAASIGGTVQPFLFRDLKYR